MAATKGGLSLDFLRYFLPFARGTPSPVVIDGKTLRRSFDRAGGAGPIHMISAWPSRTTRGNQGALREDVELPFSEQEEKEAGMEWEELFHRTCVTV